MEICILLVVTLFIISLISTTRYGKRSDLNYAILLPFINEITAFLFYAIGLHKVSFRHVTYLLSAF